MAAMGADVIVLLEVKGMNELITLGTLGPEVVGDALIFLSASEGWFFENAHVLLIL